MSLRSHFWFSLFLASALGCNQGPADAVAGDPNRGPFPNADVTLSEGQLVTIVAAPGTSKTTSLALAPEAGVAALALAVDATTTGVTAALVPESISVTTPTALTVAVAADVATGAYRVTLRGTGAGRTIDFPLDVLVIPTATADGLALSLPAALIVTPGTTSAAVLDVERAPGVVGDVSLFLSGTPDGMSAGFEDNPTPTRESRLVVSCSRNVTRDTYPITVAATAGSSTGSRVILVRVVDPAEPRDIYISRVAYGQSFLAKSPLLVANKQFLVRTWVLADREREPSPVVRMTARVNDTILGSVDMSGPSVVPTMEDPDSPSASFSSIVPPEWVRDGLELTIAVDPLAASSDWDRSNNSAGVTPAIGPALTLDLVLVPLVVGGDSGKAGNLDFTRAAVLASWPFQTVNVRVRAPYTTNSTDWDQIIREVEDLRRSDASSSYYYGLMPSGVPGPAGLGYVGGKTAIGISTGNNDPNSFEERVQVHELGHNLGLLHVACGGAAGPDENYPFTNGSTGSWGYDFRDNSFKSPQQYKDHMSYCGPNWVSKYCFDKAYLRSSSRALTGNSALTRPATSPIPVAIVSGRIRGDGVVVLDPIRTSTGTPRADDGGSYELRVATPDARVVTARFTPLLIGCTKSTDHGERHFAVTISDPGAIASAEVWRGQVRLFRQDAGTAPGDPELEAVESAGVLTVTWNANRYPSLDIVHEGVANTTLAVHVGDGHARVSTKQLPAGGTIRFGLSAGLHHRTVVVRR